MTFFDHAYEGTPTWDVGRPQEAVVRLAEAGRIEGSVLDVGCGTGENALYLAARGHDVVGIDLAPVAIEKAVAKAGTREWPAAVPAEAPAAVPAEAPAAVRASVTSAATTAATTAATSAATTGPPAFLLRDALDLAGLGRTFDTAIDIGLFHCLDAGNRRRYAESLRSVLRPGAACYLLCWSDRNAFGYGPARISRRDIRGAFTTGWSIERIDADALETLMPYGRVHAWLAQLRAT